MAGRNLQALAAMAQLLVELWAWLVLFVARRSEGGPVDLLPSCGLSPGWHSLAFAAVPPALVLGAICLATRAAFPLAAGFAVASVASAWLLLLQYAPECMGATWSHGAILLLLLAESDLLIMCGAPLLLALVLLRRNGCAKR